MQKKEKKFLKKPINGTKFTIAISSAKGGVGKSTFAINFASALSLLGKKVGVLDADVFGPSLSKLMGIKEKPVIADNKQIEPINKFNLQCMSMGFLVDENTPMIWRGPMVISAIKTLTEKVNWHDLDIIVIDMPPGTGDTQLTFAQDIKIDGAIIISSPQELALADVKRGIQMFDRTEIPIIGLIDNSKIKCISSSKDRYKRFLATCYKDKVNLNKWMVRNGNAVAYKRYSKDYVRDEAYAKENKLGVWEGSFMMPEKWRKLN